MIFDLSKGVGLTGALLAGAALQLLPLALAARTSTPAYAAARLVRRTCLLRRLSALQLQQ